MLYIKRAVNFSKFMGRENVVLEYCFFMKRFAGILVILVALLFAAAFSTALTVKKFEGYRITYDLQGGSNNAGNPETYTAQDSRFIYLAPASRDGFDFLGWYRVTESGLYSNEKLTVVNTNEKKNHFVYAKWGLKPQKPSTDADGCYQIYSAEELYGFSRLLESESSNRFACAALRKDIVVNRKVLKSDGLPLEGTFIWWKSIKNFSGVFEGNGFTISGLYGDVGLFENVGEDFETGVAVVRNLGIVDSYFEGSSVGAIAGRAEGGVLLYNVYTTATVKGKIVGGLVGSGTVAESKGILTEPLNNNRLVIKNSYNAGLVLVTDDDYGGGLVGVVDAALLVNVFNVAPVDGGRNIHVDGLAYPSGSVEIKNGFAFNTVQSGMFGGETVTAKDFAEGKVFAKLSKGKSEGSWMQNVGDDLYPKLKKDVEYFVTYSLNGGSNNKNNPVSYTVRSPKIVLANPEKEGDVFEGWYADAAFKKRVTKIESGSTGYRHFYAKWKNEYKVSYELNGGRNSWKNPSCWNADSSDFELFDPVRAGYDFVGWFLDKNFKKRAVFLDSGLHDDVVLYAKWSLNEYRISYRLHGGMNNENNPEMLSVEMDSVVLQDPVREGFNFQGWLDVKNSGEYKKVVYRKDVERLGANRSAEIQAVWFPVAEKPKMDSAGCFAITKREELYWYAEFVNGELNANANDDFSCASLENDIVVNENVLDADGNMVDGEFVSWNQIKGNSGVFKGRFYGNGHSIYGLYSEIANVHSVWKYAGFFDNIASKAEVSDLFIRDSYVNGVPVRMRKIHTDENTVDVAAGKFYGKLLQAKSALTGLGAEGRFFDAMTRPQN